MLFVLLLVNAVNAQVWENEEQEERAGEEAPQSHWDVVPEWVRLLYTEDPEPQQVIGAFESYYRMHPFERNSDTRRYERWLREVNHSVEPRDPEARGEYRHGLGAYVQASRDLADRAVNWTCIGPFDYDNTSAAKSYAQGAAHVYTVEQSTVNTNLLWAGTATAGVWRSMDKGLTWTNSTKDQMEKFCQAVEGDPFNASIAYAGLGSDLMKTTDGGNTWTEVGGGLFTPGTRNIFDIVVHPTNSLRIMLACSDGLWRSSDGGANFTQLLTGYWQEIEVKPGSPETVYAVKRITYSNGYVPWTRMQFWRGTSFGGGTWTAMGGGWPTPPAIDSTKIMLRAEIAVSPAAPNTVYALVTGTADGGSGLYGIYKSADSGTNWTFQCCGTGPGGEASLTNQNPMGYEKNGTGDGSQHDYNVALCVDPANANKLHLGGIMHWVSTDGGASFTCPASWDDSSNPAYVHADIQDIRQYGNDLWVACDGGIYYSSDGGTTFNKRMNGIAGADFWGFGAGGWTGAQVMGGGVYHNGTMLKDNDVYTGGWVSTDGGDGARGMVHPQDDRRVMTDYGYKVLSGDRTVNNVTAPWTLQPNALPPPGRSSDVVWHPNLAFTGYFGYADSLMRTDDHGVTFHLVWAFGGAKRVTNIEVAYSAPEHLYVCVEELFLAGDPPAQIWHSDDNGNTWTNITPSAADLGGSGNYNVPWDIAVSETSPLTLWAARIPYGPSINLNGQMVYKSTNGGASWTNITSSVLNNEAPTNIVRARGTTDGIYLGTRRAVYYHSTATGGWVLRNAGLPYNTFSTALAINYRIGKIRNATDHSVWESDLETTFNPVANFSANTRTPACQEPVQFYDNSVLSENGAFWEWYFPGGIPQYSYVRNPVVMYAGYGPYDVTLTVTDAHGTSTRTITNFITPTTTDTAPPILENAQGRLDVPWGWRAENPDQLTTWDNVQVYADADDTTYALYGLFRYAYKVNYYLYNAPGQEDRLVTPTINLAGNAGTHLKFYHAYAPYGQGLDDGLRVEITGTCGNIWQTIYEASGTALGTAPTTTESWAPTTAGQWQLHDIDLSIWDGQRIAIRFIGINGFGNNLYLDNIQIEQSGVQLEIQAALEGPFDTNTNLMRDDLRAAGLVPPYEPYTALGYTQVQNGGGETAFPNVLSASGTDAVVDWVWVELRDATNPAIVVATHAAMIRRDLQVVAQDGRSPLSFKVNPGNYYVAIKHRNHLGCMTATATNLTADAPNLVLFSDPTTPMYGTAARKSVVPGYIEALWMGKTTNDGNLKYTGANNDRDPILVRVGGTIPTSVVSGYFPEDTNMDGNVKYTGSGNDRDPILVNVGSSTPNNVKVEQVP